MCCVLRLRRRDPVCHESFFCEGKTRAGVSLPESLARPQARRWPLRAALGLSYRGGHNPPLGPPLSPAAPPGSAAGPGEGRSTGGLPAQGCKHSALLVAVRVLLNMHKNVLIRPNSLYATASCLSGGSGCSKSRF